MPKAKNKSLLTNRMEKFCSEYVVDLNQTDACKRAGYSDHTAGTQACRLMKNPLIKKRIQELKLKAEKKSELSMEMVIAELGRIAFFDIRKCFDDNGNLKNIQDIDENTARALGGIDATEERGRKGFVPDVTKKLKAVDKKGALELLGKHFGGFTERLEINSGEVIIVNDIPKPAKK